MHGARPSEHRRTPSPDASAAAFHESGHAVAIVRAFRDAAWLPRPPPQVIVRYVEITQTASGEWTGCCASANVYSMRWDISCIAPRYRDLMERQIIIHLAGGVAEALHRGERRAREHNCRPDQQRHSLKWGSGRCFTLCPRVLTPAHGAGWPGQAL